MLNYHLIRRIYFLLFYSFLSAKLYCYEILPPTIQSGVLKNSSFSLEVGEGYSIEYTVLDSLGLFVNGNEVKEIFSTWLNRNDQNLSIVLDSYFLESEIGRKYTSTTEYFDENGTLSVNARYLFNKRSGLPDMYNNPVSATETHEIINVENFENIDQHTVSNSYVFQSVSLLEKNSSIPILDQAYQIVKSELEAYDSNYSDSADLNLEDDFLTYEGRRVLSFFYSKELTSMFVFEPTADDFIYSFATVGLNHENAKKIARTFTTNPNNVTDSTNYHDNSILELGNGWYESEWMGIFFSTSNQWVYHNVLGWIYVEKISSDKTWLYAENKGWLWTTRDLYPNLYSHNSGNWVYVLSDYPSKPLVFDYNREKWIEWLELTLKKYINPQIQGMSPHNNAVQKVIESDISDLQKLDSIGEIVRSNLN
jgi:hypothetical protein